MAGTKEGGLRAKETNLKREPDFYARIGAKGGRRSRGGGFKLNSALAREAGRRGGLASKRRKKKYV